MKRHAIVKKIHKIMCVYSKKTNELVLNINLTIQGIDREEAAEIMAKHSAWANIRMEYQSVECIVTN